MSDDGSEGARIPKEVEGIQINFCKNVKCPNFGVPASTEKQPRGSKVEEGGRDFYTVSGTGGHGGYTFTIRCNLCRETPPLKSNKAIVEEIDRLSAYLIEAPITCPNEDGKPENPRYAFKNFLALANSSAYSSLA
jgi:hypothetical protein